MADFSFFWDLANQDRLTIHSAIPICKVMQTFMLKRDCSLYRGVAEKIFFKLIAKFANEDATQLFIKEHANQSVKELATVDQLIRKINDPGTNASKS